MADETRVLALDPNDKNSNVQVARKNMPVNTAKLEFGAPYEGWWASVRTNPKRKTLRLLGSGDDEKIDEALSAIVIEHNFVSESGQPLPKRLDVDVLGELAADLYIMLVQGIGKAIDEAGWVPKSD